MSSDYPRRTGRTTIIAALIGLAGIGGAAFLAYNFTWRQADEHVTEAQYEEADQVEEELLTVCKEYLRYWSNEDLPRMKTLLHSTFYYHDQDTPRQELADYVAEKKMLFQRPNWDIEIGASAFEVSVSDDLTQGTVAYQQHYNTPTYESWGTNIFHMVKVGEKFKIAREEFRRSKAISKRK